MNFKIVLTYLLKFIFESIDTPRYLNSDTHTMSLPVRTNFSLEIYIGGQANLCLGYCANVIKSTVSIVEPHMHIIVKEPATQMTSVQHLASFSSE